jgi:hypothetical protein
MNRIFEVMEENENFIEFYHTALRVAARRPCNRTHQLEAT